MVDVILLTAWNIVAEGGRLIQARRHRADTRERVKSCGVVVQKILEDRENAPAIPADLITISNPQRPLARTRPRT